MRTDVIAIGVLVVACNPPVIPHATIPDVGPVDAYRGDTGTIVVMDSGPMDTGVSPTDANIDAPGFDVGMPDAGPPLAILLDGRCDDDFWMTASSQPNSTPTDSAHPGDVLTALHYARDAEYLYLCFEGTVAGGDAAVVYVDTQFGDGVMLNGGLGDMNGLVNRVLSLPLFATAEFQPEWAWGATTMPRSVTTSDLTIGWRRLAMNPSPFAVQGPNESSACSDMGCETVIDLLQLSVPPGGRISLVMRLGGPTAGFSNQTFPTIDSSTPDTVSDTPISVPPAS